MTRQTSIVTISNGGRRSLLALLLFSLALTVPALVPSTALAASSVITNPASKEHHTTAVLNGHLDPEDDPGVTECYFEWGETSAYGNATPCDEGSGFSTPTAVSALVSGLSPTTTYHFRLHIETTSNGPFVGSDLSFRTVPLPSEHPLVADIGKNGSGGSSFLSSHGPSSAIHQASRRLYVASMGNESGGLYGFDASAPPTFSPLNGFPLLTDGNIETAQIAVDNTSLGSAGNVYFITSNESTRVDKLHGVSASGVPLPGFPLTLTVNPGAPVVSSPEIGSVVVSSSGEVWVAAQYNELYDRILKYSASGVFLGFLDVNFPSGFAHRLALDPDDNLYVGLYRGSESIWKLTAASGYTAATKLAEPPGSWSLAVDPSTGYLYASSSAGTIGVYDPLTGVLFDEFETEGGTAGIAVDTTDHSIYVGSTAKLHVYATGASLSPLTVTTTPPSDITGSKATLNGFVDPEGEQVTECKFEYGSNKFVPCTTNPGSGSGDVAVSAEVTDLIPNTVYGYRLIAANASTSAKGQQESFTTNPPPVASSPEVGNLAYSSAQLKTLVNPKGYETTYHFEYGPTTSYGTVVPIPDGSIGSGTSEVPVSADIAGLQPDTVYHWRLVAENANGQVALSDQTFTTFGPVKAETTGSPLRTATTAQLQGRVNPDGAPTTYRFEYGTEGPCDTNPCAVTPDRSAGSGGVYRLVAEPVEGLEPDTTYHYRVIAESSNPGGPAVGEDMTVTTRASDVPLTHGRFAGPTGSDRAYEQVSPPDTGGNPVGWALAVSDNGNRALYKVNGGTPLSVTGSLLTMLFAERTEIAPHQGGWRSADTSPPRDQLVGATWLEPAGKSDLSAQISLNVSSTGAGRALWRLEPGQPATKVFDPPAPSLAIVSEDTSRVLIRLEGTLDPAHPVTNNKPNLYDVSTGTPRLIGLLPDGSVSTCGVEAASGAGEIAYRAKHWLSPDGVLAFFETCGNLYVRNLVAEETKLIANGAFFFKWTPNGVFLLTNLSHESGDTGGSDVYRYNLDDEDLECVTCVVSGLNAAVSAAGLVVSDDGSQVYFDTSTALLPRTTGIYRVEVDSGELAYVGSTGTSLVEHTGNGVALTPDGSALIFASESPSLNTLGGQQNGGTLQFYRYDDRDRSIVCLSCPQDGSAPEEPVVLSSVTEPKGVGANRTPTSADGRMIAFATANALLPSDQNSARPGQLGKVGTDVYEWRDGRLLLVTDGLTNWPDEAPQVNAVTPSGRDIFFTAATQYTKDALDGYRRLYTARIGGGFEVPPPPKPCPLEVCQGTPKGAPEEQEPGSGNFSGSGNKAAAPSGRSACPKGRHKARKAGKTRCVKSGKGKAQQKKRQRAKHDRRNAR